MECHATSRLFLQRKPIEQELSQSSILVLPLAIVIILISYNYKKVCVASRHNVNSYIG